jgi:hypothetical protein
MTEPSPIKKLFKVIAHDKTTTFIRAWSTGDVNEWAKGRYGLSANFEIEFAENDAGAFTQIVEL